MTGRGMQAASHITRPALVSKLRRALETGPVALVAGPGYGKTAALDELRRDVPLSLAASCAAADGDPGALLVRLQEGLARIIPGAAEAVAVSIAAATQRVEPEEVVHALAKQLEELLVEPLLLVLDDAEHAVARPDGARMLATLVSSHGPRLRVAVASRSPLPPAASSATVIGPADLAFDASECARVLAARNWGDVGVTRVEAVMERTHGWPLGVAMGAGLERSLAGPPAVPEDLVEFLDRKALQSMDEAERRAVLIASVPQAIDPPLAAALGLPDDLIERVQRRGLLPAGGEEAGWLRFHPLVRDLLVERFEAEVPESERRALHLRLAEALAGGPEPAQAVDHWLRAGAWGPATQAVAVHGPSLVRLAPEVVRGWLDRLPEAHRETSALGMVRGLLAIGDGDLDHGTALLADAARGFEAAGEPAIAWAIRLQRFVALHLSGRTDDLVQAASGLDETAIEEAGLPAMAVAVLTAGIQAGLGDAEASARTAALAASHPAWPLVEPLDGPRIAFVGMPAGEVETVTERIQGFVTRLEREDPLSQLPVLLGSLAMVHEDAGRDALALACWQRGAELAERNGVEVVMGCTCRLKAAVLHARAGQAAAADREVALARRRVPGGWWLAYLRAADAWVAYLQGSPDVALSEAQRAFEAADGSPLVHVVSVAELAAEVLARVGRPREGLEMLACARRLLDSTHPGARGRYWRGRMEILRGFLLVCGGDTTAGDAAFAAAWHETGDAIPHALRRHRAVAFPLLAGVLERGALDPAVAISAVTGASPADPVLTELLDHPLAEVRRAALAPAVASGNPAALRKVRDDLAAASALVALRGTLPPLSIRLLGGFSVRRGAWEATAADWGRPAASRVARYLAATGGRPVPEDALLEALWPEVPAQTARASLQAAVSRARAVLDAPGAEQSVLQRVEGTYVLRLGSGDRIDADDFRTAAREALAERGPTREDRLARAAAMWTGEPLAEDRYADWARPIRDELIGLKVAVLDGVASARAAAGDGAGAVVALRALLAIDPADEGAHRRLIRALARAGRRGEALRQYLLCRRALVSQLGVEPTAETAALYASVLAGDPV